MNIIWLPKARQDVVLIMEFISKESPDNARSVTSKIMLSADILENSPGIGRPGRVKSTRELVLSEIPFILAYRVKDSAVEILRVLHQSRMWPKHF